MAAVVASLFLTVLTVSYTPRTYAGWVTIADENTETDLMIGLSNVQAWLRGTVRLNQGIKNHEVYVHHITSQAFAEEMSRVKIEGYDCDYAHYLSAHHRVPWWESIMGVTDLSEPGEVISLISDNIKADADDMTNTIKIQVTDQDPVVAAMMADSVRAKLEQFIISQRMSTAADYYNRKIQANEIAKRRFAEAQQQYAEYTDSHQDLISGKESIEEKTLQREYDDAFASYNQTGLKVLRARALTNKVNSPFAVLKNASVNYDHVSPIFFGQLITYLALALILTTWAILYMHRYKMKKGGKA